MVNIVKCVDVIDSWRDAILATLGQILAFRELGLSELVDDELIQVVYHFGVDFDLLAAAFTCAFNVAKFSAFDAPVMSQLVPSRRLPFFEAPVLAMANAVALPALDHVPLHAVLGLVTYLVTFEAHLLVAVE